MFFRSNKSPSHQQQQIITNYRRLMQQFRTWEKNNATHHVNEKYFKTLGVETKAIEKFYKEFTDGVLVPLDQQSPLDLPEFIAQEDIFSLLSYKVFMPFAQIFAEREAWMQRIAGTDGKNAPTSESYCKFKSLILNYHNKFVVEESLYHFEQGTLKYHHDWQAAKRQIAKELKSLRALYENWKESKNKGDREKASTLFDFIDRFERIPNQLRLKEEERFKQSELYKSAFSTDKLKATELLNKHLFDYNNPQEELDQRMKLIQSLTQCNNLFEHHHNPIGWLKNQFNMTTPVFKKLASLEHALKSGVTALSIYVEHTIPQTRVISPKRGKSPKRVSNFLPEENKSSEPVAESQDISNSKQATQPPVQHKRKMGKVHFKVQEYEENLRRLGLFNSLPTLSDPLQNTLHPNENKVSL